MVFDQVNDVQEHNLLRGMSSFQQQPQNRLCRAADCAPWKGGDAEGGAGGQANVSAQMLRAQPMAYLPSSSLAALDTPPPGMAIMVFFSASKRCTLAT